MNDTVTVAGISYTKPQVFLLQESGLGTSEFAGRTAYNSFDKSENIAIKTLNNEVNQNASNKMVEVAYRDQVNSIESSELLTSLAWVHHHHSVIEHCNLTYLIKGMSRGVLQEEARHRMQSITVQSTRYTMSNVINAFVASTAIVVKDDDMPDPRSWFVNKVLELNLLVTSDEGYARIEICGMYDKLHYQLNQLGVQPFFEGAVAKSSYHFIAKTVDEPDKLYDYLYNGKQKRNVGDAFKHIVTDNWKCDLVVTFNLRSLKNFFTLRDSGAAYFLMRELAIAMKQATPVKYLNLIVRAK